MSLERAGQSLGVQTPSCAFAILLIEVQLSLGVLGVLPISSRMFGARLLQGVLEAKWLEVLKAILGQGQSAAKILLSKYLLALGSSVVFLARSREGVLGAEVEVEVVHWRLVLWRGRNDTNG